MKIIILIGYYSGEAGYQILRAYTIDQRELAKQDLDMVKMADQTGKEWKLEECVLITDLLT